MMTSISSMAKGQLHDTDVEQRSLVNFGILAVRDRLYSIFALKRYNNFLGK